MVTRASARSRITVVLHAAATAKQHRELGAFARYCILRVERELGERSEWIVDIKPALGAFTSHIAVRDRGELVEEQGSGPDGTLATWDAICRLEQKLRERIVRT